MRVRAGGGPADRSDRVRARGGLLRPGDRAFDYEAWRAEGAPEAPLRAEFAASYDAARERRPQDTPGLDNVAALYARGEDVEPLVAMQGDRVLSSGNKVLILFDGRHRTFAAAHVGVERLP
jgi:hypothetical protein